MKTCYRLRARDAGFSASWDAALAIGYDRLEAALLDYAIDKVERDAIDPDAIEPEAIAGSVAAAIADRSVSHADLQFAVALLNRHRAAIEGRRASGRNARRATEAETDAALRRALDMLARRVKPA